LTNNSLSKFYAQKSELLCKTHLSNPRILYIDDDKDSCEMIGLMLNLADDSYEIMTASTAGKALTLIESQPFDLYILDHRLPVMTGVELCRQLRENNSQTPIIFYSAMAREIDRREAMAAGATEYLVKPNDLDKFTETVKRLLNDTLQPNSWGFRNKPFK